ncbi:MAG: hypothetical protein MJ231_02145 [bacterium]|nr:hypothetical protein [bacterium]
MKKIIAIILLLIPIVAIADDYGVRVPEWKDYAPPAFVNVKEQNKFMKKINIDATYWYERKVDFEKALEDCKAKEEPDERFACYEQLKQQQYEKNAKYNAREEAQNNLNNGAIPEMNNRIDSMIPLNNYINTFTRFQPNELQ